MNKEEINEQRRLRYHNKTDEEKAIYKEKMKQYHKNNIEKSKEYRKKNIEKINAYMVEWRKSYDGIKSSKISNWKQIGLILESNEEYNELYEKYLLCNNCEACDVPLTSGNIGKNRKALDHNHKTGEFRNIVCHKCNVKRGFQDKIDDPDYNILHLQKKEHLVKKERIYKPRTEQQKIDRKITESTYTIEEKEKRYKKHTRTEQQKIDRLEAYKNRTEEEIKKAQDKRVPRTEEQKAYEREKYKNRTNEQKDKQNAKACEKYKQRTEEDKAKRKIYRENKKLNKNEIKI